MWALVPSPCTYASTVIWGSGQRANSQHTDKLSPDRYRAWQLNGSQRDVLLTMRQLWEPITAVTCLEAAPPPCINLKLRANSSCQEGVKARNLSFKIKVVCISVNVFIGTDCFRNCWSVIFCFTCQQCNILEELPSLYFISAFMWQMNWTEARCKIIHGLFTVLQTANVDWVVFVFIVLFSKVFIDRVNLYLNWEISVVIIVHFQMEKLFSATVLLTWELLPNHFGPLSTLIIQFAVSCVNCLSAF